MTDADLDRLESLANAATPGPWALGKAPYFEIYDPEGRPIRGTWFGSDAAFIAAARTALPALIAECRRLSGLLNAEWNE